MGVEEKYMKVVQDREAMLQFAACLQIFFLNSGVVDGLNHVKQQ